MSSLPHTAVNIFSSLSPAESSEVTIAAPNFPYKVVLRPEFPDLSPLPDSNYFHVTDWIYNQEAESVAREHHSPIKPFRLREKEEKRSRREDFSKAKQAYLVDREETEPGHRELLREKICMDLNSFYYYKERHLFRPRDLQNRAKLPKLDRSSVESSPRPGISSPRQTCKTVQAAKTTRPTPNHQKTLSLDQPANAHFLGSLFAKCAQVPPSHPIFLQTKKELRQQRRLSQRLNWTKQTLDEIRDCEVDILIPYYKLQKEALEDFERDAQRMVGEFRQSSIDRTETRPRKVHK